MRLAPPPPPELSAAECLAHDNNVSITYATVSSVVDAFIIVTLPTRGVSSSCSVRPVREFFNPPSIGTCDRNAINNSLVLQRDLNEPIAVADWRSSIMLTSC